MKIPFLLKLFKEILLEKNYPEISLALKGSKANLKSVLFILLYAFNNSDKFIFADKNKNLTIALNLKSLVNENKGNSSSYSLDEEENNLKLLEKCLELLKKRNSVKENSYGIEKYFSKILPPDLMPLSFDYFKSEHKKITFKPKALILLKGKKLYLSSAFSLLNFLNHENLHKILMFFYEYLSKDLSLLDKHKLITNFYNSLFFSKLDFNENKETLTPQINDWANLINSFKSANFEKVVLARTLKYSFEGGDDNKVHNVNESSSINFNGITPKLIDSFLGNKNFKSYLYIYEKNTFLSSSKDNLKTFSPEIFVSLTPETLIKFTKNKFFSEALAGSFNVSDAHFLLKDKKNLLENNVVLKSIIDDLTPFSQKIAYDETKIITLPYIAHLITKIKGRFKNKVDIFEVLHKLQPTPATLGYPKEKALEFIKTNSHALEVFKETPQNLNYYAGIAGFYSKKQKTGKFIVLLRSGNILKDSISLYGGAGIMPISNSNQEWQETAQKMKPMMTEFFNL